MADFPTGVFIDAPDLNPVTFDAGDLCWSARRSKTGWLKCDATAYSRTTYAVLFAAIVPTLGAFTVTLASPGVFTLNAHGLVVGDRVYLTTTGALPTGLSANTIYYVVSTPTANTFTVSAAEGGSAVNTSGSQSGAHTLWSCPHGLGDGSTTFNVPDAPGRSLVAAAGTSGHSSVRAQGQNDGVALANRSPKHNSAVVESPHNHTQNPHSHTGGGSGGAVDSFSDIPNSVSNHSLTNATATNNPASTGLTVGPGGTLPIDQPANLVANLFIKT